MSKKTKRQSRKTSASTKMTSKMTSRSPLYTSGNGTRTYDEDFNPDYTPVIQDLRRIATIAGSFFVILVILAFVMPFIMP
jgi:hypothetical protein